MWDPQRLTALWASMACYRDSFTFFWWEYRRSDGTEVAPNQQANINFSMVRGMRIVNYVLVFLYTRIVSAVKRVEFISDKMYIILRGRWCDIIVRSVLAPTEDKIDGMEDSFYEELERVFDKFPKYSMKILLGDFSANVGREDIFS
jgi:hypothetical protein